MTNPNDPIFTGLIGIRTVIALPAGVKHHNTTCFAESWEAWEAIDAPVEEHNDTRWKMVDRVTVLEPFALPPLSDDGGMSAEPTEELAF